ncbi:TetR/AcrR family transcriptional regulator [Actinacidiphila acidipaludis]|uniref:TetR/AcrR family transcriptional regulator n=1 Tax=Actinacidiphila acidipaludis TaxID=2873382 RepID=A0ABS7QH15_9ACTN|nr:TetR/AcrR family transcriptional regulator [Streptomyces acidipaludis]MBY8881700.1 TetR/AcrR family transcriptional regulator [Streptomyces acidipaludis]
MPTARDALLDAAFAALGDRPWTAIRMVEIAAAAGVSRQTLYNEFHSKDGLVRALAARETEAYLGGVERALDLAGRDGGDPGECFAAAAGWTLRSARRSPLVRAGLTGPLAHRPPLPDLVTALRLRAVDTLEAAFPGLRREGIAWACEAAIRLTLSYVVAPAPSDEDACLRVARLVRSLLVESPRGGGTGPSGSAEGPKWAGPPAG